MFKKNFVLKKLPKKSNFQEKICIKKIQNSVLKKYRVKKILLKNKAPLFFRQRMSVSQSKILPGFLGFLIG